MPTHQGKTQTDILIGGGGDSISAHAVSPDRLRASGSVADNHVAAMLSVIARPSAPQPQTREHVLLARQVGVPAAAAPPNHGPVITIKPKGLTGSGARRYRPIVIRKRLG